MNGSLAYFIVIIKLSVVWYYVLMFGNYPVNDDWIFVRQVEAFNQGIFTLSAESDPSFVTQGFIGLLWGKLFGIDFLSLQILTFLTTLIGALVFVLILKKLNVKKPIIVFAALLLFFNPVVFVSAFTFMTENYYLVFFVSSIYFFLKYFQNNAEQKNVIIGSALLLLATLVRQVGILIGISFIVVLIVERLRKNELKFDRRFILSFTPVIISIIFGLLISFYWPRFGSNRAFILSEDLGPRLKNMLLSLHYFPLFLFPLFAGLKVKLFENKFRGVVSFLLFALLVRFLYVFDFYPVGNVFYIEEIYTKSDFRSTFSLFDNIFFKSFFAVLTAYCITKFLVFMGLKVKAFKYAYCFSATDTFLFILGSLNFLVLIVSSDFYDRYLVPSFVCFFLLFIKNFANEVNIDKRSVFCLVLIAFIVFTLQWEFSSKSRLMWKQAWALSEKTGLVTQISLNDTYINYIITQKQNDFTGLIERTSFEKKCFVQDYSLESESKLLMATQNLEEYIDANVLEKKKPYLVNKKEDQPRAKKHLDALIFNQEYFSFLLNTVGKRAFVASWCVDNM